MSLDDDSVGPVGRLSRLALATLVLFVPVFVVGATVAPPDPYTQLRWMAVGAPLAFLTAYWLVYRRGWERLRTRRG